ncbi:MAG: hypothetical protein HMLKMBBP_03335 [Planctomycetes bacterium]|nr:hypothetical protein [Planctomycetota bacterium]
MLDTRLVALIRGHAMYEVVEDGRTLFTGTLPECRRFEMLHDEKRVDAMRNKRRRDKPEAKIFRIHGRLPAASAF